LALFGVLLGRCRSGSRCRDFPIGHNPQESSIEGFMYVTGVLTLEGLETVV
jgi:hypothetical protein